MNKRRVCLPAVTFSLLLAVPGYAATRYVNAQAPGPAHDGTTWATAFLTVSSALSAAQAGDEVWVAQGTYSEHVTVPQSVALYGGFAGTENDRSQRRIISNPTVMDGSQAGTVVTCPAADILVDGFTIRNAGPDGYGVRVEAGAATLSNNTIAGCMYGVAVAGGTATLQGNTVSGNDGGVGIFFSSTATLDGNTIAGNLNVGVHCSGKAATLVHNTLSNNSRGVDVAGPVTLKYNTLSGNDIGVLVFSSGTATVANNIISSHNIGVEVDGGIVSLTNNSISGSKYYGVYAVGTATLTNNTIAGNGYAGVYVGGQTTLTNNIVAFNRNGVIRGGTDPWTCSHNDVYGNTSGNYTGLPKPTDPTGTDGNISVDPQLFKLSGDIHIQPGSPCINAGDDRAVAAGDTDIDGQPRIIGPHVDIGADESDGTFWLDVSRIWHVAPSGDDANDGLTWAAAKKTVTAALSLAQGSDEVWVAAGAYAEHVTIPAGVGLYGGFAGTESGRDQRDIASHITVLDGGKTGTVVTCPAGASVVDGFTIQNGGYRAAGVTVPSSGTATLVNNTISGSESGVSVDGMATLSRNTISGNDYGVYVKTTKNASATLTGNVLSGNGYGVADFGAATLYNNTIIASTNSGVLLGGQISTATMTNNIVALNGSHGLDVRSYEIPAFAHNDVYGNESGDYIGFTPPVDQGNLSADPQFVDSAAGNYRLSVGSPCINAGDDSVVTPGETDAGGLPRKTGARVDIGAYEFLTPGAFTMPDVAEALRLAAGLEAATESTARLDVVGDAGVSVSDAVLLVRKAAGLEANP